MRITTSPRFSSVSVPTLSQLCGAECIFRLVSSLGLVSHSLSQSSSPPHDPLHQPIQFSRGRTAVQMLNWCLRPTRQTGIDPCNNSQPNVSKTAVLFTRSSRASIPVLPVISLLPTRCLFAVYTLGSHLFEHDWDPHTSIPHSRGWTQSLLFIDSDHRNRSKI